VFEGQFEVVADSTVPQPRTKEQLGSERVQNPHDPDGTYQRVTEGRNWHSDFLGNEAS
jgi:hypothetical protein